MNKKTDSKLLQLPQLPLLVLLPDFDQNFRRTFANSGSLETGGQRQSPQGLGELQVKLRRLQKQRRRPGRESGPTGPTWPTAPWKFQSLAEFWICYFFLFFFLSAFPHMRQLFTCTATCNRLPRRLHLCAGCFSGQTCSLEHLIRASLRRRPDLFHLEPTSNDMKAVENQKPWLSWLI